MEEKEQPAIALSVISALPEGVWEGTHPALKELLFLLLKRIETLEEENRALREEVRKLRSRLNQDSSNSSKPPSSDPPWKAKKKRGQTPSGRRRGGKIGHAGHHRALLPPEQVDRVVDHFPALCGHCGTSFDPPVDSNPDSLCHQVTEIPPMPVEVVEHRLHSKRCPKCCRVTCASLPSGVSFSPFGPRLHGIASALTGRYRLSRREAKQVLEDFWGVKISLGGLRGIEQRVSTALASPVAEAVEAVRTAPVVNGDETGWRESNEKAWLWTFTIPKIAVYRITPKRSGNVVIDTLGGEFSGVFGSDRWTAYQCIPMERRQICHAHLRRDFQKMADFGGASKAIGEWGIAEEKRLFDLWEQYKCGDCSLEQMQKDLVPIRARMKRLLLRGQGCGDRKTQGTCKNILKHWDAIWTFVRVKNVEPTNNTSEQALRKGVLWRKGSFGTQSSGGSRFAERILTVAETCRRQGRNLLRYLVDAVETMLSGKAAPSLLPDPGG